MSILNILKKIRLPRFEDDFIQDQAEQAIEEGPVPRIGRVVYDPRKVPEIKAARENLREWMDEESEKNNDPADPASGELWTNG